MSKVTGHGYQVIGSRTHIIQLSFKLVHALYVGLVVMGDEDLLENHAHSSSLMWYT